ncbi:amidohydrolase [Salipaludibacillus sp. CF4.18]|uniref:amidohydrolase n=1 Tax=Salipaludibacillus sp. CF4.18 TaxID=3373081 RepID=UPI003EE535A7
MKDTRIFYNGQIFTSNPMMPYANAMVVREGRVTWIGIGEKKDLEEELVSHSIDLQGRRVLPGFIDAHLHPLYLANASKQIACTPPIVYSIQDLVLEIRKRQESQSTGEWIESWGYDEGKLTEKRAPTRVDLDRATTDAPVIVTRTCGHIIAVNSLALKLAGIDKDTQDPPGGNIDKDSNGEPTGILRESARDLIHAILPEQSIEESAISLAELSPKLSVHGITSITDLLARKEPVDYLDMYNEAREKGLKQRTVLYYNWDDIKEQPSLSKQKTNREKAVHIGGVKVFSDGSVSGQTAWVNPPFVGGKENYGIPTTSETDLLAAAEGAKQNNIQLVVHAMGEQAIDLIVDTFYNKKGWLKDAPSIRIEHAAMPTKKAIKRAAETGIAFVPQPIFLFAEIESYLQNLGTIRTKQAYPVQTMLNAGIKVAFSSDAPATAWADPVNPFIGIQAAVTRIAYDGTDTGQDEKVDVSTAITLYTRAAQEITRIPDVGQLAPGFHADFIVLDQDILHMKPEDIGQVQVEETYISGELVHQKEIVKQ